VSYGLTRKRLPGDRNRRKKKRGKSKGQGSGANAAFTWNKKSDLFSLLLTRSVTKLN